ncbi:DUF423 domain-containing protein [Psychroflexus planctonicus]|uniref:Membrane protein n=1 Tax=Psychroflexus planctonicus TaxID=1526575 RepID=A0ABQ1SID9_9FLAO|nr:DUF423 domain-containing protein [Psychroflexus planctonicus]GGE41563.1 membrane protein [Psychroflexus planctonicus]
MDRQRKFLILGSIFGVTAVILGAFGAHALKEMLSAEALASFETGVKYQMYHALLLLFLGVEKRIQPKAKNAIYYLLLVGIIFFSFSIYLLATNNYTNFDFKSIAFITPIGGTLIIIAWFVMLFSFFKKNKNKVSD